MRQYFSVQFSVYLTLWRQSALMGMSHLIVKWWGAHKDTITLDTPYEYLIAPELCCGGASGTKNMFLGMWLV